MTTETIQEFYDSDTHLDYPAVVALRAFTYEGTKDFLPGIHYQFCSDQKYATLNISNVPSCSNTEEAQELGLTLWMTWYKTRQRTGAMYILSDYGPPRIPTLAELDLIVEYYTALSKAMASAS